MLTALMLAFALVLGNIPSGAFAASKSIEVYSQKELNEALKSGKYTRITLKTAEYASGNTISIRADELVFKAAENADNLRPPTIDTPT